MSPYSTPAARWSALTARDPAASNAFIYSVTSTKIYCRPTCPARLARRANVLFHDTAAEAEAAGNRACMRCRPGSLNESADDPQKAAVAKACALVKREGNGKFEKWSVKILAKEVGLTESHFCRVFKKTMGMTVGEYRASLEENEETRVVMPMKLESMAPILELHENVTSILLAPNMMNQEDQNSLDNHDSNLARDWLDFSGPATSFGDVDMFSGLDTIIIPSHNFSPETSSDVSTPTIDDCFQFLDFEAVNELDNRTQDVKISSHSNTE
jgi:methylphosphotriester-DNA--protein-cysteine methyltransferase